MSSQYSVNGERFSSGKSPVALPLKPAIMVYWWFFRDAICIGFGFRGQAWSQGSVTLPMEDSDQVHGSQVHILDSNVFRAQDPLCSCPPGKPPPNLPFGCLHQPLFRKFGSEKLKIWVSLVPHGPSFWSSQRKPALHDYSNKL